MKDKTAERLADAWEGLFAEHHFSMSDIMETLLHAPLSPKRKKLARIVLKAAMKQRFKKFPEPTKDKLSEVLAMANALKGAPHKVRKILLEGAKKLPHAPGGPLKKIKPEEEVTVCAEIFALRAQCDNREAIRRVASKRGVSERTIYRIWGTYYPKKKRVATSPRP